MSIHNADHPASTPQPEWFSISEAKEQAGNLRGWSQEILVDLACHGVKPLQTMDEGLLVQIINTKASFIPGVIDYRYSSRRSLLVGIPRHYPAHDDIVYRDVRLFTERDGDPQVPRFVELRSLPFQGRGGGHGAIRRIDMSDAFPLPPFSYEPDGTNLSTDPRNPVAYSPFTVTLRGIARSLDDASLVR